MTVCVRSDHVAKRQASAHHRGVTSHRRVPRPRLRRGRGRGRARCRHQRCPPGTIAAARGHSPSRRPLGPDAGSHPLRSDRGRSWPDRRPGEQRGHRNRRLLRCRNQRPPAPNHRSPLPGRGRAVPSGHPWMLGRGGGHIVNVSSMADCAVFPGLVAYSASKAALSHLTAGCGRTFAGCRSAPPSWSLGRSLPTCSARLRTTSRRPIPSRASTR
jgi:hypothetical protein